MKISYSSPGWVVGALVIVCGIILPLLYKRKFFMNKSGRTD
jgi:hypothetical protein